MLHKRIEHIKLQGFSELQNGSRWHLYPPFDGDPFLRILTTVEDEGTRHQPLCVPMAAAHHNMEYTTTTHGKNHLMKKGSRASYLGDADLLETPAGKGKSRTIVVIGAARR
ncbi:unnamed protein product [Urochloa humidicola]